MADQEEGKAIFRTVVDANMLWGAYEANLTYPDSKWIFIIDSDALVFERSISSRIEGQDWRKPVAMGVYADLTDYPKLRPPENFVRDDSFDCATAPVCKATLAEDFQKADDCCACPTRKSDEGRWELASPDKGGKAVYRAPTGFIYGGTGFLLSRGLMDAIPASKWKECAERLVCGSGDWRLQACITSLTKEVHFVDTSEESRQFMDTKMLAGLRFKNIGLMGFNFGSRSLGPTSASMALIMRLRNPKAPCPWHLHKINMPCAELILATGSHCFSAGNDRARHYPLKGARVKALKEVCFWDKDRKMRMPKCEEHSDCGSDLWCDRLKHCSLCTTFWRVGAPDGVPLPPTCPAGKMLFIKNNLAEANERADRLEALAKGLPPPKSASADGSAGRELHSTKVALPSTDSSTTCCKWDPNLAEWQKAGLRQKGGCGAPNPPPLPANWLETSASSSEKRVMMITMNHGSAGFFAFVQFAINQLRYAEEHHLTPYVFFGPCTVNGEDHYASGGANLFFDANRGPNMWDYYFEPVSSYRSHHPETPHGLPGGESWRLHHVSADSVYAYPYGSYRRITKAPHTKRAAWYRMMRKRGHQTVSKYIHIKPHILEKADVVWKRLAADNTPVLGAHVRATDKLQAIGGDIVTADKYYEHIDHCIRRVPSTKIFLATDSQKVVGEMKARYGERLLVRELVRSEKNAIFDEKTREKEPGSQQGEDVLIDSILLSRTDGLLKSSSAVSEFAMYLTDQLHDRTVDLQYGDYPGALGTPCGKRPDRAAGSQAGFVDRPLLPPVTAAPFIMPAALPLPAGAIVRLPLRCLPRDWMTTRTRLLSRDMDSCVNPGPLVTYTDFSNHLVRTARACARRPKFTVQLLPAGWFSFLNGAIKPLMHAIAHGGELEAPLARVFTDSTCSNRDLTCFFEPPAASCPSRGGEDDVTELSVGARKGGSKIKGIKPPPPDLRLLDWQSQLTWNTGEVGRGILPVEWTNREWFWWVSQTLSYLMTPNAAMRQQVDLVRKSSGLAAVRAAGARVIGVHIRHGDACLQREKERMARTCESLSAYMKHVAQIGKDIGSNVVYLATDSPQVVADTKNWPGWTFITMKPPSSRAPPRNEKVELWDDVVKARMRQGDTSESFAAAWEATVEVMLLSESDAFVGKFTSNLFRNAFSLKAAACDCAVPYVSLDSAWCFDYGKQVGVNPHLTYQTNGGRFWC